ncbi:MAG TPA: multidrug effflux MFS transporter [Cellulomonas sp.]
MTRNVRAAHDPARVLPSGDVRPLDAAPGLIGGGRRQAAAVIATIALLGAIGQMGVDIFLPGLAELTDELSAGSAQAQASLSGFMVGLACGQLVFGPLSDRLGRRGPLLVGTAVSLVAGAAAAAAPSIEALVAARAVQGATAAAGVVLGRVIVTDLLRGVAAARAFSVLMVVGTVAPIAAPVLGGALVHLGGWRLALGALAALTAVALVLAVRWVPETLPAEQRRPGAVASVLVDCRRAVAAPDFRGYAGVTILSFGALMSFVSASARVFEVESGLTATQYSLLMATCATGMLVASSIVMRIVGRVQLRALVRVLVGAQLVGTTVLAVVALAVPGSVVAQAGVLVVVNGCTMVVMTQASLLALEAVPQVRGTAAAIIGSTQYVVAGFAALVVGIGPARPAWVLWQLAFALLAAVVLVVAGVARSARARAVAGGQGSRA